MMTACVGCGGGSNSVDACTLHTSIRDLIAWKQLNSRVSDGGSLSTALGECMGIREESEAEINCSK
eukprot:2329515-Rhodomonas_salina.2